METQSRYTVSRIECRIKFPQNQRCHAKIALHPPKSRCRAFLWTPLSHFPLIRSRQGARRAGGGYRGTSGAENGSRYRGVPQLQSHQSRYSVQLRTGPVQFSWPRGVANGWLNQGLGSILMVLPWEKPSKAGLHPNPSLTNKANQPDLPHVQSVKSAEHADQAWACWKPRKNSKKTAQQRTKGNLRTISVRKNGKKENREAWLCQGWLWATWKNNVH